MSFSIDLIAEFPSILLVSRSNSNLNGLLAIYCREVEHGFLELPIELVAGTCIYSQ
jgi:hypothetical protein